MGWTRAMALRGFNSQEQAAEGAFHPGVLAVSHSVLGGAHVRRE